MYQNLSSQPVYVLVAERVKEYPLGCGRAQIADDFNISKSTALEHLEKCVRRGLLAKSYTWLNQRSRGWVYMDAASMVSLNPDPDHKWDSGLEDDQVISEGHPDFHNWNAFYNSAQEQQNG